MSIVAPPIEARCGCPRGLVLGALGVLIATVISGVSPEVALVFVALARGDRVAEPVRVSALAAPARRD